MIKKASFLALVSCAVFSASCYAAGQYAQALGDCIYDNLSREDKNVMTQWAFVTLGKTDAAKQITVIPESKNKQVNKEAKKRMTRLMTEACAREAANVALHESKSGLQDAAAQLGIRLAKEQLKDKTVESGNCKCAQRRGSSERILQETTINKQVPRFGESECLKCSIRLIPAVA